MRSTSWSRGRRIGAGVAVAATAAVVLAAGGDLDTSYGTGGIALSPGRHNYPRAFAVQADGMSLIGSPNSSTSSWHIERHTADGALDPGFGVGGVVSLFAGAVGDAVDDLTVDASGRCIAVGRTAVPTGKKPGTYTLLPTVVRLQPNGALDSSFGGSGIVRFSNSQRQLKVTVQPDGRIVVAGWASFTSRGNTFLCPSVTRLLANGALDTGFGTNGFSIDTRTSLTKRVSGVALQSGGQVVVASGDWTITRFLANGLVDTGFAPIVSPGDVLWGLAVDGSDRIVATGFQIEASGFHPARIARYTPSGATDSTFGSAGVTLMQVYASQYFYTHPAFQADGRILVGLYASTAPGGSFEYAATVRFLDNGTTDTTYGSGGVGTLLSAVALRGSGASYIVGGGLGLAPDGEALLCGDAQDGSGDTWFVARYLAQ